MPDQTKPSHPDRDRSILSFVRRSPRMNTSQQKAWDRHFDSMVIDVERSDIETSVAPDQILDFAKIFGRQAPLVVEIGSGMGHSLIPMAKARPEDNFVAFEVYQSGIASTLGWIGQERLTNIRMIVADAVAGIEHLFADKSISELWTFFPDPWHKKKHHKRRLIQPTFIELIATKMIPEGIWRIATDWDDYAEWILDAFNSQDKFINPYPGESPRFVDRPITKFEQRGLDAGRTIHDFTFRRAS